MRTCLIEFAIMHMNIVIPVYYRENHIGHHSVTYIYNIKLFIQIMNRD